MPGTKQGAIKARDTNIERYGANFYEHIGRVGGSRSTTGGFASQKVGPDGLTGRERARIAGARGGKASRRRRNAASQTT